MRRVLFMYTICVKYSIITYFKSKISIMRKLKDINVIICIVCRYDAMIVSRERENHRWIIETNKKVYRK